VTDKQLEALNVKIAKKLGWKRFRKERLPEPLQKESRMTGLAPGNIRNQFVPTFTSNLAYAMQLVDWAHARSYEFQLAKGPDDKDYTASFYGGKQCFLDWGTLPSMAICLAFLQLP
jgi:hypothetical protein